MDSEKSSIESPQTLMQRIPIEFNDVRLLTRALTHRSYINENSDAIEDNERLEFLGDAVLDFLVGEWLYNRFPEMEEGQLTKMRSALVQTNQLSIFTKKFGMEKAIRLGRGEIKNGGSLRDTLLCDVFEAFVGALFLDQGMESVKDFIYPLLEEAVVEIIEQHKNEDPKSKLQEWAQSHGFQPPRYTPLTIKGPDHAKVFEIEVKVNSKVMGSGTAKSKQSAEKIAAKNALKLIDREG